jgi:hypothetical protein
MERVGASHGSRQYRNHRVEQAFASLPASLYVVANNLSALHYKFYAFELRNVL